MNHECITRVYRNLFHDLHRTPISHQGRSDGGGISVYIPPQISLPYIFVCGCSVSLQGLVNIYAHPNQIPGYASVSHHSVRSVITVHSLTPVQRDE